MLYCNTQDIAAACRLETVLAWAKDDSRELDNLAYARIEQAIVRATDEINLYIGKVVSLPLDVVPSTLKDMCVNIALYKVISRKGLQKDSADQIIRMNYEDAVKQLKMVAEGVVSLGLGEDQIRIPSNTDGLAAEFPKNKMMP